MSIKIKLLLLSFFSCTLFLSAKDVQTIESLTESRTLSSPIDLHITGTTPFGANISVDLTSPDAWLFLDNIRPSDFMEDYSKQVKVNGQALDVEIDTIYLPENSSMEYALSHTIKNARVNIYRHGTVVIPQDTASYNALTVYEGKEYSGSSMNFISNRRYYDLGEFDNKISSFKLKRGYMATFANDPSGRGFSRVFIADEEDIEIPVLQDELIQKASFIAIFDWQWPSKKGWCSSGRNAYNELELTESTWWYSWSADRPVLINQEYVPIKQKGHWPSNDAILNIKGTNHLLGLNEPDRPDQANATVQSAIDGWPALMATGLRLGTPAIADNLNWLYNFMEECDKRNFRVDFVAIHAYWGGPGGAYNVLTDGKVDIKKWYNKLKEVHERTGRPLWITEWNNGANWTSNGEPYWSNDTLQQQLQNKEILNEVLNMMDTCSFIERYSIYNWVEDRRAIVKGYITQAQIDSDSNLKQSDLGKTSAGGWSNQYLTLAGVNYKERQPAFAFNRDYEVLPRFAMTEPELTATINPERREVNLSWVNNNGSDLTSAYVIERMKADGSYEKVLEGTDATITSYSESLTLDGSKDLTYRVGLKSLLTNEWKYSEPKVLEQRLITGKENIRYSLFAVNDLADKYGIFATGFQEKPIVVFGGQSHVKRTMRATTSLSSVTENKFNFKIWPWLYLSNQSISDPEYLPVIAAKSGHEKWGDLDTEAGSVAGVTGTWKTVTFKQAFETTPVVFVTAASIMSGIPVAARVRNVTKEGFEVCLTKEKKQTANIRETVNYFAIEQGTTTVNNKKIAVGVTDETVGETSNIVTIPFGSTFSNPVFYCGLQTANDEVTVTLRYQGLTDEEASVVKLKELSSGLQTTELDAAGWMVIEAADLSTGIETEQKKNNSLFVYPTVTTADLNVEAETGANISIYTVTGIRVKNIKHTGDIINVSDLAGGVYIIAVDGKSTRFIKK